MSNFGATNRHRKWANYSRWPWPVRGVPAKSTSTTSRHQIRVRSRGPGADMEKRNVEKLSVRSRAIYFRPAI